MPASERRDDRSVATVNLTLGIEEELMIVDADTDDAVAESPLPATLDSQATFRRRT